jgi:hypothetical protein
VLPAICFGRIAGLVCWAKGESESPFGVPAGPEIGGNRSRKSWKSTEKRGDFQRAENGFPRSSKPGNWIGIWVKRANLRIRGNREIGG